MDKQTQTLLIATISIVGIAAIVLFAMWTYPPAVEPSPFEPNATATPILTPTPTPPLAVAPYQVGDFVQTNKLYLSQFNRSFMGEIVSIAGDVLGVCNSEGNCKTLNTFWVTPAPIVEVNESTDPNATTANMTYCDDRLPASLLYERGCYGGSSGSAPNVPHSVVPELPTWALLACGLAVVGMLRRQD